MPRKKEVEIHTCGECANVFWDIAEGRDYEGRAIFGRCPTSGKWRVLRSFRACKKFHKG